MSPMSYYSTIPSWILSNQALSYGDKLVCALLSGMSQKNGYCFATNDALASALGISNGAVLKMLQKLDEMNIISIHNKKTKKAGNRQIRLVFAERIEEDDETEQAPDLPRNEIEDAFDRFYEVYPRKEKKVLALKMFKSKNLHKQIGDVVAATKNYASKMSDTDKQFIMLPATFLNNQIWEEHIGGAEEAKKIGSGAAKVSSDPIFDLVQKCMRLKSDWFDTLVYEKNSSQMSAADVVEDGISYFSDIEINVINEIGFKLMLRECTDGDFVVSSVVPVWERLSK